MLQEQNRSPEIIEALKGHWATTGAVRLEHALTEGIATGLLEALRKETHSPEMDPSPGGYQLWRFPWTPENVCNHFTCRVGRFLHGDGLQWAEHVTGLKLKAAPGRVLVSDMHSKGAYFDAYDDAAPGRAVAFQLGLTPAGWQADWGGHLELLSGEGGDVSATMAPAWNTLDLFDVRSAAWRRMPVIEKHLEGYTVSGWYHLGA